MRVIKVVICLLALVVSLHSSAVAAHAADEVDEGFIPDKIEKELAIVGAVFGGIILVGVIWASARETDFGRKPAPGSHNAQSFLDNSGMTMVIAPKLSPDHSSLDGVSLGFSYRF